MQLVIGTYTRGFASEGIYRLDVGADGGEATLSLAAKLENPSWQVRHPRLPVLYSVVETRGEENEGGAIVAFRVNDDGALSMVARVPSMGGDPCHLSVAGDFLLASNYDAGNLAVWRLDDNGVPVSLEIWPEMFHIFQARYKMLDHASQAVDRLGAWARAHAVTSVSNPV